MILSNVEIVNCLRQGKFKIEELPSLDPTKKPFNTSAVDLRLSDEIIIPAGNTPTQLDLRSGNIASFLAQHSISRTITDDQPYSLAPNKLVLAKTMETVDFLISDGECYSARVEGKSSLARCGILVHFTAPTIHAGFRGTITLEIINLGPQSLLLTPGMSICQLIIEEVKGRPLDAPNQFKGQSSAVGNF
jgi:dCTP deaminase